MYCPKCKSEYREGFFKCADCGIDLVEGQPPDIDTEEGYIDFVEVFSTYQQSDIVFIKSVLEGEGINYFFQGENSAMLIGAGAYARLLIQADQAERARDILREMEFL